MILLDVNLLLYARFQVFDAQHERARVWIDQPLSGEQPVGIPWTTQLGFARLATNPRIFAEPLTTHDAVEQLALWLSSPVTWVPQETAQHFSIFTTYLTAEASSPKLVTDAHLAALAVSHDHGRRNSNRLLTGFSAPTRKDG